MFFRVGDAVRLDHELEDTSIDTTKHSENLPRIIHALRWNVAGYEQRGVCNHICYSAEVTFLVVGCAQIETGRQWLLVRPIDGALLYWCTSACVRCVQDVPEFNKDSVVVAEPSKEIKIVDGPTKAPLVSITRTGKMINIRKDNFLAGVVAVAELFGVSGRAASCGISTRDYGLNDLRHALLCNPHTYPRLVVKENVTT